MLDKWQDFTSTQKIILVGVCIIIAVISGLILSAYVLSWGLKFPIEIPKNILLWPEMAIEGSSNEKTNKWIKLAGFAFCLPSLLFVIAILKHKPKIDIHGKASFAKEKEIVAMGLRSSKGLICGFTGALPTPQYGKSVDKRGRPTEEGGQVKIARTGSLNAKNMLVYGGPEHMILYAPTRSGKGVGVVVPNLLNWPDSTVVLDIKKENWNLTAGFRKEQGGQDVYLFDPLEPNGKTHCWNPLSSVRRGHDSQIDDLQKISSLFIPQNSKDPFFDLSARNAFVGVGGYLAETPELPFTLGEIYRQLTMSGDFVKKYRDILKERAESSRPLSPHTVSVLNDFLSKSENTFESVKSTITAHLGIFANPIIDRATSRSDFDFADLRKRRMSIYVGITPNNLDRLAPIISLFFQSCADANTNTLPEHDPELKHKVLMCLDEFAALGEMQSFKKGISFFAGYNLKVLTVLQTPAQLADIYGQEGASSYIENAGVEVIFTPKSIKEAKNISERLGTFGADASSESKAKFGMGGKGKTPTISTSIQGRALMLPQELTAMPQTDAIVLIAGHPAVQAKKIRYYAEQVFLDRTKYKAPDIPSINNNNVDDKIAFVENENRKLNETVNSLSERINAMAENQQANIASGQPAEVEMTVEEILNPDTILAERLAIAKNSRSDKLQELKEANRIGTKEGQCELLELYGIEVSDSSELMTA